MATLRTLGLAAVVLLFCLSAWAQPTPVGLWRTVDDQTGQAKAEIRIREGSDGVLSGVIERTLIQSGQPTCELCTDDRKGKPKLGLEIIRGARKAADESAWVDGHILDPENGRSYRLRLVPLDEGARLQVRGYVGPFYRTQTWIRVQ